MFKRSSPNYSSKSSLDTLVGPSTRVNGDIFFAGGFHLDGQVAGNVCATEGPASILVVSEHGSIEGSVEAPHVILHGTVNGDVKARERIELGATARVNGNVYYGVIEMATGARIEGKLVHQPLESPPTAQAGAADA